MLVTGDFAALERLSGGQRLTADEMRVAITDYPGSLVMPPHEAFQHLDIVPIQNSKPREWSVIMSLWTDREGRSDLSLETTLTESQHDLCLVEVDGIHVR